MSTYESNQMLYVLVLISLYLAPFPLNMRVIAAIAAIVATNEQFHQSAVDSGYVYLVYLAGAVVGYRGDYRGDDRAA